MSRPKDQALVVMDYFRAAPLDAAQLLLRLATQEVRRRVGGLKAARPMRAGSTPPVTEAAPLTASARKPRRAAQAAAAPLPGIQETVGG